jgi:Bacterial Ig-like domain (group 3)
MSRAFTRALVLSTIGGLAVAPGLAFAATGGGGSTVHAPTVTTVLAPKHAQGGHDILLSARVSLATKPTAPNKDLEPERKRTKGGTSVKKGKGGKGKRHHRANETGEITFVVDGKALTPVRISHGRALEKLQLAPGNHTAVAEYSGDGHYNPSESAEVNFTVS